MSVHTTLRTTSLVAASALALNACTSADGAGGLLDKVASSVGSIMDTSSAAATVNNDDSVASKAPMKVVEAGLGCIVTHTKGRAVISSAGDVHFNSAGCDASGGTLAARTDAIKDATPEPAARVPKTQPLASGPELIEATAHFQFDSVELIAKDRTVLDEIITRLGTVTAQSVEIRAFADPRGPQDHNHKLSQARAQMIAEYLALRGLDAVHWHINALGEDNSAKNFQAARRADVIIHL